MNLYRIKVRALEGENYDANLPFTNEPTKEHVINLLKFLRPNFVPIIDCVDCISIEYVRPLNEDGTDK